MILGIEYKKEKLIYYLERLKQEISKPICLKQDQFTFCLILESNKYNGFSCSMFNQIRNIISKEIISISNFGFECELWTNNEPYTVNESFLKLLEDFTNDIKKTINIVELKSLFDQFIMDTNRILI